MKKTTDKKHSLLLSTMKVRELDARQLGQVAGGNGFSIVTDGGKDPGCVNIACSNVGAA